MKALRHTKTGELYPMNEHLAKHEDIEFVELDEKMRVIEPEEVGPAAELPEAPTVAAGVSEEPAVEKDEEAAAEDTATAETTKSATSRTRKKTATEGN